MAEIPEGAPVRFTWRRLMRRVVKAEGPERIAPEWWRELHEEESDAASRRTRTRDYYRVEDHTGARYWVYRDGLYQDRGECGDNPAWYVHGLYG